MLLPALIAAALFAPGPGEMGAVRVFTALAWVGDATAPSVVLRSFESRRGPFHLIVDPRTLETRTAPAAAVRV
jgi:hypothetical protein